MTLSLYTSLASRTEQNLRQQVLAPWYPRAIDRSKGGFFEAYDEEWKRPAGDPNTKSIVYQSRLTWVAAKAAQRYPEEAQMHRAAALHGLAVLSDKLWDREKGGFYWNVSETGEAGRNGEKHAYGIAFAIYAASAVYETTRDARALDLAKRAYAWLETHSHDGKNRGYYEAMNREGKRS
jgi:mannobiose 2-epimerase